MYKINWLEDSHDCETCGFSGASGYIIEKNGEVVVDKTPYAHCFDSADYSCDSPYADILKLEGIEFEEDQSYGSTVEDQMEEDYNE